MKDKVVIVGIIAIMVVSFLLYKNQDKIKSVLQNSGAGNSLSEDQTSLSKDPNELDINAQGTEESLTNKESDGSQGSSSIKNKNLISKLANYQVGSKAAKNPELISANTKEMQSALPNLRLKLSKSECKDLVKTKKGADFTCRTKIKIKGSAKGKGSILQESSYKGGELISFATKMFGSKELASFEKNSKKRKSSGNKKPKNLKEIAPNVLKFSLENRAFIELYMDQNYMVDQFVYHSYEFKKAILHEDFYKERDFQDRLDILITQLDDAMKIARIQCDQFKLKSACQAFKKYGKLDLEEEAKNIIERAEADKIESAFFD